MLESHSAVNVLVIAGSLREGSLNHKLAELACAVIRKHGGNAQPTPETTRVEAA